MVKCILLQIIIACFQSFRKLEIFINVLEVSNGGDLWLLPLIGTSIHCLFLSTKTGFVALLVITIGYVNKLDVIILF